MTRTTGINHPSDGTKEARLVDALSGKGKTLAELAALMEWQPHTTRAAMTRLRKRGFLIERIAKSKKSAAKFRLKASRP